MSWNYRVVKASDNDEELRGTYTIREVYYNEAGEICGITKKAIYPLGDNEEEIIRELKAILHDVEKHPVLIEDEIKYGKWDFEHDYNIITKALNLREKND